MFGVEVFDVFDWDMLGAPLHFLAAEALAFSLLTLALQYLSAHVAILSDAAFRSYGHFIYNAEGKWP